MQSVPLGINQNWAPLLEPLQPPLSGGTEGTDVLGMALGSPEAAGTGAQRQPGSPAQQDTARTILQDTVLDTWSTWVINKARSHCWICPLIAQTGKLSF